LRPIFFGTDDRRIDGVQEAIERHDLACLDFDHDPSAARPRRLMSERPPDEPVIESSGAPVESLKKILAGEEFWAGVGHDAGRSSTDGLVSKLAAG
jgi:hypothetical protein